LLLLLLPLLPLLVVVVEQQLRNLCKLVEVRAADSADRGGQLTLSYRCKAEAELTRGADQRCGVEAVDKGDSDQRGRKLHVRDPLDRQYVWD